MTALQAWLRIPDDLERAVRGADDDALDARRGSDTLSLRETVHHLVEANLVASTIVIAAIARPGSLYDWSWLMPGGPWMRNVGYDTLPVGPALDVLRALSRHIAALLERAPEALQREIRLVDAPDAEPYAKSVDAVLADEVAHAASHLADVVRIQP